MADIFTSDFEGGSPFSGWDSAAATVTQNTSIFHGGAASAAFDATSVPPSPILGKTMSGLPKMLVSQFWFYYPNTFPFREIHMHRLPIGLGGSRFYINVNADVTNGLLLMQMIDSSNQKTASFSFNTWYRVTYRMDVTTNIWVLDWNFNGVEKTPLSLDSGGAVDGFVDEWQMGNLLDTAANEIHYMDDVRLGDASSDYELYKGSTTVSVRPHRMVG